MLEILKSIGKSLLSALLTEAFIKEVIVFLLEKISKKTTNSIDDALVEKLKEALDKPKEEKPSEEKSE
jgi:hypothetical protein